MLTLVGGARRYWLKIQKVRPSSPTPLRVRSVRKLPFHGGCSASSRFARRGLRALGAAGNARGGAVRGRRRGGRVQAHLRRRGEWVLLVRSLPACKRLRVLLVELRLLPVLWSVFLFPPFFASPRIGPRGRSLTPFEPGPVVLFQPAIGPAGFSRCSYPTALPVTTDVPAGRPAAGRARWASRAPWRYLA